MTFYIGEPSEEAIHVVETARRCLELGMAIPKNRCAEAVVAGHGFHSKLDRILPIRAGSEQMKHGHGREGVELLRSLQGILGPGSAGFEP